jgi:hypothetical protein
MLSLSWIKCGNGANWCPFDTVDLSDIDTKGVYIVWHEGSPGRGVYVGQGDIAARITTHRSDKRITAYEKQGRLRVTWASVPAAQRDGVECYLADKWNPLVGDAHPDVRPIAVNSPWG